MSDIIDRGKLLKVFEERKKPNNGGEDGTKERYRYMQWLTDYNAVIEAPTAQPKKGEWIDEQQDRWIYAKCSECLTIHDVKTNYCPNCGADMRGEKDGK